MLIFSRLDRTYPDRLYLKTQELNYSYDRGTEQTWESPLEVSRRSPSSRLTLVDPTIAVQSRIFVEIQFV